MATLGDLTVRIGGDTSGLKSALEEAGSLAAKFTESAVGAIGAGIGGMLIKQMIASGAFDSVTSSISGAVTKGLANISLGEVGTKLSTAIGDAFGSIDLSAAKAKLGSVFSGISEAAAPEFAAIKNAAATTFAEVSASASAGAAAVGEAISGATATVGSIASGVSAVGGVGASMGAAFAGLAEGASSAAAAISTFATETLPAYLTGAGLAQGVTLGLAAGFYAAGAAAVALTLHYGDLIQQQALFAAQGGESFQTINTLQTGESLLGADPGALTNIFSGGAFSETLHNLGGEIDTAFSASRLQEISAIVDRFEALPDPVDRAALAVKLFGDQAPQALALMNDSTKQAVAQAYDLSQAWDQSTRESLTRISDFWNSAKALFSQSIDFTAGWDGLKQAVVTTVTDLETNIRQFVLLGQSDFHDMGTSINASITDGLRALSNTTGIDFSGWFQVGKTLGATVMQGLASVIPDAGLATNLKNDAFMQQMQASINKSLGSGGTSGISASLANPGAFQAVDQIIADNTATGDSYTELTAAVNALSTAQQKNFDLWKTQGPSATLADAITQTQALIDKDQGLIDKTDAYYQQLQLIKAAWGQIGLSNPANVINNQTDNNGNVTALSPVNSLTTLFNSGALSDGQNTIDAYYRVTSQLQKALDNAAISQEQFDAALAKLSPILNSINFGKVLGEAEQFQLMAGPFIRAQDWAGLASLQDRIAAATNGVSGLNKAFYDENVLLDELSKASAGYAGDLASAQEEADKLQQSPAEMSQKDLLQGMGAGIPQMLAQTDKAAMQVAAQPVQDMAALLNVVKVTAQQSVEAMVDANTQIQASDAYTAKEKLQSNLNTLQAIMDQERYDGEQVSADQSAMMAKLKESLNGQADLWTSVHKNVEQIFSTMSGGLANAIVDWKNFGSDIENVLKQVGTQILQSIIQNLILSRTNADSLTTSVTGLLQKLGIGGPVGGGGVGTLSTAGLSVPSDTISSVLGGGGISGGGAAASTGKAAATGGGGILGALGGLGGVLGLGVNVASGIVQGVQMSRLENLTGEIEVTTRKIQNEITNERADLWSQQNNLFLKMDDERQYAQIQRDQVIQLLQDIDKTLDPSAWAGVSTTPQAQGPTKVVSGDEYVNAHIGSGAPGTPVDATPNPNHLTASSLPLFARTGTHQQVLDLQNAVKPQYSFQLGHLDANPRDQGASVIPPGVMSPEFLQALIKTGGGAQPLGSPATIPAYPSNGLDNGFGALDTATMRVNPDGSVTWVPANEGAAGPMSLLTGGPDVSGVTTIGGAMGGFSMGAAIPTGARLSNVSGVTTIGGTMGSFALGGGALFGNTYRAPAISSGVVDSPYARALDGGSRQVSVVVYAADNTAASIAKGVIGALRQQGLKV